MTTVMCTVRMSVARYANIGNECRMLAVSY